LEPKKVTQALDNESWVEAMQEELLQFKLINVWTLVDLPHGKKAIGTKWVFKNKKDQRGIVVRNKARLVALGYRQEEGVDYDEVFALVARIEVIRLFLTYASYMDFTVYQMDLKSAFLYGTIEEEVYVSQPPGFMDPEFPNRVYKVEKALYGLHQAPRAWYETLSSYLLENGFKRGTIDKTLFIKKIKNDILFVYKLIKEKMVYFSSTLMETHKSLSKDTVAIDVDVHLYRFLKGKPNLGLWYPKDSPMDLIAYSDSNYVGASLDRKSTTRDNESAICVVKNPIYHSKTKHIEIRHHFIRDSHEKKLIEMVKIHIDYNVADLLTKAFDVTSGLYIMDAWNEVQELQIAKNGLMLNTATSKTVNTVKQIHAIVDDKAVVISESSVRSDLLLNDEDGITWLANSEIFENLALMGYEQLSTKLAFQKGTWIQRSF
ncbi:putative ribonuclease H-like domain-containing protein, partial [Tanacetum coccineum]